MTAPTTKRAREHTVNDARAHGGAALRSLRLAAGKTQLWVEAEADLGTGYLQRVEAGKVARPSRETVERILDALGAGYRERRGVFDLYGYALPTPLPDADDHAWAREESAAELAAAPFPAYVLDCGHRLVAWNAHMARLLSARQTGDALASLAGRSILAAWFDPATTLPSLVVEPDRFFPALLHAMRYEMRRHWSEPWREGLFAELLALPLFRRYWDVQAAHDPPASSERAIVPLRLFARNGEVLTFRLTSEPLARDDRFRVVGFIPADDTTLRWLTG